MLKYTCFILLIIIGSLIAYGQDKELETTIDENLKLTFPSQVDSSHAESFKIYRCSFGGVEFSVSKGYSKVIDRSKEEFDNSMNTFWKVADSVEIYKNYKRAFNDTILGGTKGIFVSFNSLVSNIGIKKIHIFYTTKNSFTYSVYAKCYSDTTSENEIRQFYKSLKFKENYYETLPESNDDLSWKQIAGKLFGWLTVLAVLSYLLYSLVTGKKII